MGHRSTLHHVQGEAHKSVSGALITKLASKDFARIYLLLDVLKAPKQFSSYASLYSIWMLSQALVCNHRLVEAQHLRNSPLHKTII